MPGHLGWVLATLVGWPTMAVAAAIIAFNSSYEMLPPSTRAATTGMPLIFALVGLQWAAIRKRTSRSFLRVLLLANTLVSFLVLVVSISQGCPCRSPRAFAPCAL